MSAGKRVGRYELGKTLGEGTFGKVKSAKNVDSGEKFAIKILDKDRILRLNMGSQIKQEITIMKKFSHPNIVQLKEVLASKTKIYLVLELVSGGELFDEIVREKRFNEEKARYYFKQLIHAVEYCHNKNVCHRDLKPENLLLTTDHKLKISDFGLSALYIGVGDGTSESVSSRRGLLQHTTCGTPSYVAPEVLDDEGYNGKVADIWSIGVILYVLVAGALPFDEKNLPALFEKIQSATYKVPSFFSQSLSDLLSKILVVDPKERSTIHDIKNHPWFCSVNDESAALTEGGKLSSIKQIYSDVEHARRSHRKSIRLFNYQSQESPVETCHTILRCLREMDCDVRTSSTNNKSKIRAQMGTSKGIIGISISISEKSRVEIRRGKGDIMEYHRIFNELVGVRLGWIKI